MSSQPSPRSDKPRLKTAFILGATILVAAAGFTIWWRTHRMDQQITPPDMDAAIRANNRGVGLMERFKFDEAIPAFEEVTRLAPDWLPDRINLGIALINNSGNRPADKDRAAELFREVLRGRPTAFMAISVWD